MLLEAGGICTAPVTAQTHTALTLQALGYSHAYIGFTATEAFRVDLPFAGKTLLWKLRLLALHARLQRYDAMAHLIFLMAPVVYLLAELRFIQAPIELWAAYALPHLFQHRLAQARMQGNTRFTTWIAVREALLAGYMLVRTALSVIRTELVFYKDRLQGALPEKATPFGWRITLPCITVLALNLAGLMVGSARLPVLSPPLQALAVLCLLWSAYNLMLLAAQLAVAEEARHIQRHTRLQLRVPAMLKLPSGRSIFCATENFPEAALELKLPTPVAMALDGPINLSIFYGDREFLFPICVESQHAMILRVTIKDAAQPDYRTLGIAVRSRGENWPQWLPDRDADHPLPRWLSQRLVAMYGWTRAFATNFGPRMRGLASLARLKNGKKND
jgi:cellulose synthase (UDP-forming)